MNRKLWEVDDSSNQNYPLTGGERGYIYPESDRYEGDSKIEDKIEQKAHHLPERFQRLFNDFALLQYGGYLEDLTWDVFSEIEPRAQHTYRSDTYFHVEESKNIDTQIGFEIGSMFNRLSDTEEDVWKDIVWGFLLGFVGENAGNVATGEEIDNFGDVMEVIKRANIRSEMASQGEMSWDYYLNNHAPNTEIVRKYLYKYEITDVNYLIYHLSKHEKQKDHNRTTESYLDYLIQALIQNRKLRNVDNIYTHIIKDTEIIKTGENNHIQGIDPEDCLNAIYESNSKINAGKIATEAGLSTNSANLATAVLKRLSDSKDEDAETWTQHYVVEKSGGRWKLTAYGKLLCYNLFGESYNVESSSLKENIEAIYRYSLIPDTLQDTDNRLIENCINEIDSD